MEPGTGCSGKEKLKEQAADSALSTAASQQYIQFMQQNGEPGDNEGAPRVTAHGNSSAARGLRNNNPGNIEAGSNSWDGQAGSDGRFAKFVTPEHGIRALGKTCFRTSGRVTTQLARSLIVGRRPATAITQKRTLPHYAKAECHAK